VPTETTRMLLELFVAFLAAKTAGEIFSRLRLPAVVGEVIAGVILGPSLLGWVRPDAALTTVGTLGVIVLLFQVGLETPVTELAKLGGLAVRIAIAGVAVPLVAGWALLSAFGYGTVAALFGGAALVATSVGITARVLSDEGLSSTREAKLVLAAAVVDDILGLLILAFVTGLGHGAFNTLHLVLVLAEAAAFVAFQLLVAPTLVARSAHLVTRLRIEDAPLSVALAVLLGLSALAEVLGLAAIVGAFFAGMAASSTADRFSLDERIRPLAGFLVPYFFVLAGAQVDVHLLLAPAVLLPGLALAVVAVASKVLGGGLGALSLGSRRALAIGMGMVPRGEVGLIVAQIGLSLRVVPPALYGMVVLVVLVTTVVAPPLLPPLFRRACACALPGREAGYAAGEGRGPR
jgi:Kef-type K+ transport system membrane component KefB